jgi:hypothetical protein
VNMQDRPWQAEAAGRFDKHTNLQLDPFVALIGNQLLYRHRVPDGATNRVYFWSMLELGIILIAQPLANLPGKVEEALVSRIISK